MVTPWNDDPAGYERVIQGTISALLVKIITAAQSRVSPTVSLAQDWHRALYRGVPLPVVHYAGEFRDADPRFPELIGYEAIVGSSTGVTSSLVPDELNRFEAALTAAIGNLDTAIPIGASLGNQELMAVLRLMALTHGEWVRIHPFANGNGRTARVWANWIAIRYELEAFVGLKPRPAHLLYAGAAAASMRGDHAPMLVAFHSMLRDYLAANASGP